MEGRSSKGKEKVENCFSSSKGKEKVENCSSPPSLAEGEVEVSENPDEFSKEDMEVAKIFLQFNEIISRYNEDRASAAQARSSVAQPVSSANWGAKRKRHRRPPSNGEKPQIPSSPSTTLSSFPSTSDSAQKKPSRKRAPKKKKSRRNEGNDMVAELKEEREKPQHISSNLPDLNIPAVGEEPDLNIATAEEPTQITSGEESNGLGFQHYLFFGMNNATAATDQAWVRRRFQINGGRLVSL